MEPLVATAVLLIVMVGALTLLARTWVRSSRVGGYRATHGSDGLERGPQVPEDDDSRWHWPDGEPKS